MIYIEDSDSDNEVKIDNKESILKWYEENKDKFNLDNVKWWGTPWMEDKESKEDN